MSTRKVFSLYNDGNHIDCFETYAQAIAYIEDGVSSTWRYADIVEEDYEPNCDCKNTNIYLEDDK